MAVLTRGNNFAVTETVTNTKLHNLVDLATVTGIVDADISPSAAIQFSKLLASSISGALLTNLNLIPSAAGLIPFANIPVPFGSTYCSIVTIPNQSLQPLTLASWVDGIALRNLCSTPVDKQIRYNLLVSSIASGDVPAYNGADNFVGRTIVINEDSAVGDVPASTDGTLTGFICDTARTRTNSAYGKVKEIIVPRNGALRIKFDLHKESGSGTTAYGKIYRNGSAVGVEKSSSSDTYETQSDDVTGWTEGDLCQLYVKNTPDNKGYCQNFRIYEANPTRKYQVSVDQNNDT